MISSREREREEGREGERECERLVYMSVYWAAIWTTQNKLCVPIRGWGDAVGHDVVYWSKSYSPKKT